MIQSKVWRLDQHSHINWAFADQAMVSGTNFLTGILLARYLGIEEFGRFTLIWMLVLFVNSIQHALINSPMMSLGPQQSEETSNAYFGAILVQQIVFSFLIFSVLLAGIHWSEIVFPQLKAEGLALPLACAAVTVQFQDFLRRYFFTRGRVTAAFVNDVIRYAGQLGVLIWLFISYGDDIDSALVLWTIAIMAAVATVCGGFLVEKIEVNIGTLRKTVSKNWHFSKWLIASALMHWTTGNLFIISAGFLLGASTVGALRATQNLMGIVHILLQGLENIVPVKAAWHLKQDGIKAMSQYLRQVIKTGGAVTASIGCVVAVAPELWLQIIFGQEFQGYGFLLKWYAVIYLLEFLSLPLRSALRALEDTKSIFLSFCYMTCFSVLVAYPLIANFELTGVMVGILGIKLIQITSMTFAVKSNIEN